MLRVEGVKMAACILAQVACSSVSVDMEPMLTEGICRVKTFQFNLDAEGTSSTLKANYVYRVKNKLSQSMC